MTKKTESPKAQRIKVFARCRPMSSAESQDSTSMMEVEPETNQIVLKDRNSFRHYSFDQVFPPESEQVTVYKAVVEPLIQEVLQGYSCTVFAYGQTGTGKTYTMEGERTNTNCSWFEDPTAGVIPRSLHQVFEELNQVTNATFEVRVSFLEIYNEEVYDLLSTDFTKLRVYEDCALKDSVKIKNLEEVLVKSKDEVYTILERGTAKRHTAETKLNACSSRSHTVFTVMVDTKDILSGSLRFGKLNLVDLAGSENVGRSGAVDKRAREAGNINQSLLTLGRVITALIEKQPHVPYRESKLTRILQYSLNGHTKTSIIATVSPAVCNLEETISTLEYASKAKAIDINPEITSRILRRELVKELTQENKILRMENEKLKKDLAAARSNQGFFVDAENYEAMRQSNDCMDKEIKALKAENSKLQQEILQVASDSEELHAKIRRVQTVAYSNEDICEGLRVLSQKQCANLYDMVADYSKERIKFSKGFKEDQDRLNHELSEHKKKTIHLRETLSNELQLLLNSVLDQLNVQATCESQRASDLSQDLKSFEVSLILKFEDFLTLRLPSLLDELNAENASIAEWVAYIHSSIKEKVNQHVHFLNNQNTEKRKELGVLKGLLECFFANHDAAILDYHSKIEYFSRLVEKLNKALDVFASVKHEMGQTVQFENISKFEDNAFQLRTLQIPLDRWDGLIRTTEEEVAQFTDVADNIKPNEYFQKRKSNMPFCGKLTNALDDLKKSEINNYEKVADKIKSRNVEALKGVPKIRSSLENGIASIATKMEEEYVVEDKLVVQEDILAHLGGIFVDSENSFSNATSRLQKAILEKDLEIDAFISDAFVKDVSTGTTPQRRTFRPPTNQGTTSPYLGFLQGMQFAWHDWQKTFVPTKVNDESNCTDDDSFLNVQDISTTSDVYDSNVCDMNSAIKLETLLVDNDRESNKENEEVLGLPRRKSVRFSEPITMNTEQHLKASPLSPRNNTNPEVGC